MHGKEEVIAPLLERELGVRCVTPRGYDTDRFGSFSGEVKRQDTALNTARAKALGALAQEGGTLAVASEGSFGPHPSYFILPADEEFVCLVDAEHDLFITGWHLTEKTNFASRAIACVEDLEAFCAQVGYPQHRVILQAAGRGTRAFKEYASHEELLRKAADWLGKGVALTAETDMRAMNNPTRLAAIEAATTDLVGNILSGCPKCRLPGFSVSDVIRGVPCGQCGFPTRSVRAHLLECRKCGHQATREVAHKTFEDPAHCDLCNP
jgi:hypothetical protein